jgi:hypothetical protein
MCRRNLRLGMGGLPGCRISISRLDQHLRQRFFTGLAQHMLLPNPDWPVLASGNYNQWSSAGSVMNGLRDPERYRKEAARFRELAAAATDSRELRDSYLALSIEYERLAQLLSKPAFIGVAGIG